MTVRQLHTYFKLELDNTSTFNTPSYEPEEIDYWLNEAIRKFAKTRYSGINAKHESFEQSQKRIDDLRTLIKTYSDATLTSSAVTGSSLVNYTADLPTDYWLTLDEEVTISFTNACNQSISKRQGIKECTLNTYRQLIDDAHADFKLHYDSAKPLRLFIGTSIQLTSDGNYTITAYHMSYMKKPTELTISVNPDTEYADLPSHTHNEIIKLAVQMALENTERFDRYQSYSNEVNSME
jgi:hypothetical protein